MVCLALISESEHSESDIIETTVIFTTAAARIFNSRGTFSKTFHVTVWGEIPKLQEVDN